VNSAELVPQLERAELDYRLVIDDGLDDSRFRVEALCAEPLSLLASSRHPLFALGTIGAQDLRDQPFLLTDPGCAYRTKLERALATANVRLKAVMEFASVETIKQCAGLGMGIACLPTIVAETEIAARKLVALRWSGSDLGMPTLAVWHKDKWMSPGMQAFLSLLREHLSDKSKTSIPVK